MSSDEDVGPAVVKGALSYTEDKIKELVRKFKDRKIAFIQDESTINLVKEQLKSGEWDLCKKYIRDERLRILIQMGLTLRALDLKQNYNALQNLRGKIVQKYGNRGLHISQFIQNKILNEFIGSYVGQNINVEDMINDIELLLNNLEKQVVFIKAEDDPEQMLRNIDIKLTANSPDVFIIFARESALSKAHKIREELLRKDGFAYGVEIKQERKQLLIFLFKKREEEI